MTEDGPTAPAVIVTLPAIPAGAQIAVRHMSYGIDVDYREHPRFGWFPIQFVGGTVELVPNIVETLPCVEDVGRTDEVRNNAIVITLADVRDAS